MEKILLISHKLNFTQNTLGCYGLLTNISCSHFASSPLGWPVKRTTQEAQSPASGISRVRFQNGRPGQG